MRRLPLLALLLIPALIPLGCQQQQPQQQEDPYGGPTPLETGHMEPVAAEGEDLRPRDGDEALEWLLAGNERFVSGQPRHDHETMRRRMALLDHQRPFATILGCSDSRVSPELIFDHGLGDLFVVRVAGNVLGADEAGSIEYGLEHLEAPLVVVLGHEGCGAVTAALGDADHEPEELVTLLGRIRPALAGIDRSLPMDEQVALGVAANIRQSVERIRAIAAEGDVPEEERARIIGAVYELESGHVHILD